MEFWLQILMLQLSILYYLKKLCLYVIFEFK